MLSSFHVYSSLYVFLNEECNPDSEMMVIQLIDKKYNNRDYKIIWWSSLGFLLLFLCLDCVNITRTCNNNTVYELNTKHTITCQLHWIC